MERDNPDACAYRSGSCQVFPQVLIEFLATSLTDIAPQSGYKIGELVMMLRFLIFLIKAVFPVSTHFYSVPSTLGSIATGAKPCRRSVEEPCFWDVRTTIPRCNYARSVSDECRRCRNGLDGG